MKNFKIVRIQALGFLRGKIRVDELFEERKCETYSEMYKALVEDASVYTAGFGNAMGKIGNRATELFYDCETLQKKWALEQTVEYSDLTWKEEIAVAQLKYLEPEVLFFQDIFTLPEDTRRTIKKLIPSIKLVIIQKGYPGETRDLSDADVLLVSSPILFDRYKSLKPFLIYHSFDDSLISGDSGNIKPSTEGFTFAGSSRAPEERYWMLRCLLQKTPIKLWLDESQESHHKHGGKTNPQAWKEWLRHKLILGLTQAPNWYLSKFQAIRFTPKNIQRLFEDAVNAGSGSLPSRHLPGLRRGFLPAKRLVDEFPNRCYPSVFGLEYYDLLKKSELVFNIHSSKSVDTVDNMKLFEVTGIGSCLLTDTGRNMGELFEEDSEVVTYKSADEAIEKAWYLIDHPDQARNIAAAGKERTLAQHTMYHRCEEINEIIEKRL